MGQVSIAAAAQRPSGERAKWETPGAALAQTNVRLIHLEVAPADIAPVKFIFEAYEEVAIVRTVDRRRAVIVLLIAPDFFEVAEGILASLQRDFACREIPRPCIENDDWLMREVDEDA